MSRPAALISAARGIGDILRVMPLARVCMRPGYDVDLLLAPDYSGVAELLERVDGIRRVFLLRERWGHILTRDILFESRRPHFMGLIDSQSRWSNASVQRGSRSPSETPHLRDTWPLSAAACRVKRCR
jgi:hypothetical protein